MNMGKCVSKHQEENPTPSLNEDIRKNRLLKAGVAFKDIEFGYVSRKHKSFTPILTTVVEAQDE